MFPERLRNKSVPVDSEEIRLIWTEHLKCGTLTSWDSFSVTLPSISLRTCMIFSSIILGTDVFRDWPFLGCSFCVSLVPAANFRLFLNVAIFLKGKRYAVMKTELVFIF